MKIELLQNIIDVIRGKKEIRFVKVNKISLKIPPKYTNIAFETKNGKIVTNTYESFLDIVDYNKSAEIPLFYNNLDKFSSKNIFPTRYENKLKYFEEKVIPIIDKNDIICDIGCANGDFTFEFAKHCKHIDGYELSQKMVDTANNRVKDENIKNLNFYQASCDEIKFKSKYDKCFLMGVLCYVMDDMVAEKTLSNIDKVLKLGGYIIYRDNLNLTDTDYFFFGPSKAYKMVARSKKKILNMFEKLNYNIFDERTLHTLQYKSKDGTKIAETISYTMILQKTCDNG